MYTKECEISLSIHVSPQSGQFLYVYSYLFLFYKHLYSTVLLKIQSCFSFAFAGFHFIDVHNLFNSSPLPGIYNSFNLCLYSPQRKYLGALLFHR